MSDEKRKRLTLQQQSEFIGNFVSRCRMHDGAIADETRLIITNEDAQHLEDLESRLRIMSLYEDRIKKLVTGR